MERLQSSGEQRGVRNGRLPSSQGEVVMEHMEIAQLVGLTLMDLECLVKGEATLNVAKKLGVSMMDIQEFTQHGLDFEP
jgi:hypothetical protein